MEAGAACESTCPKRGGTHPWRFDRSLPNNEGSSVTYFAHQIAAEVIRTHKLPTPLVWIEHWPEESADGGQETFDLVVFSSYKVEERAPSDFHTFPPTSISTVVRSNLFHLASPIDALLSPR